MASRLIHLRKLMRDERLVITLIRGAATEKCAPSMVAWFESLSREAWRAGLTILIPASSYAGFDETRLLSWLAILQRENPPHFPEIGPSFRAALKQCAKGVDEAGMHLDYRAINRHQAENRFAMAPSSPRLSFPSRAAVSKQRI